MSSRRCAGHNAAGKPCSNWAIRGGTVCRSHGGSTSRARAKAAVRAAVLDWGLGDAHQDPGEVLLRLVTQSARRCASYAAELEQHIAESDTLRAALVAQAYGEFGPVGEYIRGLVTLEGVERDRCAGFAAKAVAAGLARRQVELAERQGQLIAQLLTAVLTDPQLGLSVEQRRQVPDVARRHLALVAG